MEPAKHKWFSDVFEAGLTHQFYGPGDVLAVATPRVLAEHLPRDVMAEVLAVAMKAKLTPDQVVSTVTARVLAKHVPGTVLWKCITGAADKSGLTSGEVAKDRVAKLRDFFRASLESALENNVLRPADVVKHLDASVLVESLPHELTAKLISAALDGGTIDPGLVIKVIGVVALAEHAPPPLLWKCVQEIHGSAPAPSPASKKPPAPTNGEAKKAPAKASAKKPAEKPDPKRKPQAPAAAPEDQMMDFHEAETDVRDPRFRNADPPPAAVEIDSDDGIVEIVEEEDLAEELVAEDKHKKSGKIAGLFSRRKR